MKVLFDTNIILDVLLRREPYNQNGLQLVANVETGKLTGYVCATTITTIHYLTAKILGAARARKEIQKIIAMFDVAPVTRLVLDSASRSKFKDFEDAVIYESAREVGADAIVTRNTKDFKKAALLIYSPGELLSVLAMSN